jgi:hypothetical protein
MPRGRGKESMAGGKAKPSNKPLKPRPAPPKAPPKAAAHPVKVENGMRTGFQLGHQLWKLGKSGGKRLYANPQELWDACVEYFDWVEANALEAAEIRSYEGEHELVRVPKMRAMSVLSLCVFLDISNNAWYNWRKDRADLREVIDKVEAIIYTWKFDGAAAGLLNSGIIARELGLIDKREQTGSVQVIISGEDAKL